MRKGAILLFQELFANPTITIVHIAEFFGIVMLLWFILRHNWQLFIKQSHQNQPSQLGISHTGFELSLGKLRLAGFRRTAELPAHSIYLASERENNENKC